MIHVEKSFIHQKNLICFVTIHIFLVEIAFASRWWKQRTSDLENIGQFHQDFAQNTLV